MFWYWILWHLLSGKGHLNILSLMRVAQTIASEEKNFFIVENIEID